MKNNKLRCTAPRSEDAELRAMQAEIERTNTRLHEVATLCATVEQERDAALARLAESEAQNLMARQIILEHGEGVAGASPVEPNQALSLDTSVLQAAQWPPAGDTQPSQLIEPEAMRYDFDGFGWKYIDNGSGSDWMTRHPDGEFLFTKLPAAAQPSQARVADPVVRYEPERYDEDRVRMALDSDGDWVRYSDYLTALATPQAAAQPEPYGYHSPKTGKVYASTEAASMAMAGEVKTVYLATQAQPSQAQPPAPDEAAREYMTGYSDGREWAGATNQAQPSQAVELSDGEVMRCISESACYGTVRMSFESGPYSIDKPSLNATKFANAIIAAINAKGDAS